MKKIILIIGIIFLMKKICDQNNLKQIKLKPERNLFKFSKVFKYARSFFPRYQYRPYYIRGYRRRRRRKTNDSFLIMEEMQRNNQVKQVRSILTDLNDRVDDLGETINHRLNEINNMLDRNSILRTQQMGINGNLIN